MTWLPSAKWQLDRFIAERACIRLKMPRESGLNLTTNYDPIAEQYKRSKQQSWESYIEAFGLLQLICRLKRSADCNGPDTPSRRMLRSVSSPAGSHATEVFAAA